MGPHHIARIILRKSHFAYCVCGRNAYGVSISKGDDEMFNAGDKITVRARSEKLGFVQHSGTFMEYVRHGERVSILYDWNGMGAQYALADVDVTARK
jgi:hypothetical protein